jgi:hypothetical protein
MSEAAAVQHDRELRAMIERIVAVRSKIFLMVDATNEPDARWFEEVHRIAEVRVLLHEINLCK